MNFKKILFLGIKCGISFYLIYYLFFTIGFSEIYKAFLALGFFSIFLFMDVFFSIFICAFNLRLLLNKNLSSKLPYFSFLSPYSLSWALGSFGLGRFGEGSIIYFLKKYDISMGYSLSVFILDKLISLVVLVLIAFFGFIYFRGVHLSLWIILLFFLVLLCFVVMIFNKKTYTLIKKIIPNRYLDLFPGFHKTLIEFLKNGKLVLLINFIITALRWLFVIALLYFIFYSFGQPVHYFDVLFITAIGSLVSLIPISLSGLGLRESIVIYLYSLLNVQLSLVFAISLMYLAITYSLVLAIIFIQKVKEF